MDFSLFHRGCGNYFIMRIPFLWALAASLFLSARVVSAEEVQLVSLKDPIEDTSLMFPRDVSTVLFTRSLKHLPAVGEKEIDAVELMRIIDTDHASYYQLGVMQDLVFHLSLNSLQRVNHITVTGWDLEGTTMDIKVTSEPIAVDEPGWKILVEGTHLGSPSTSVRFAPSTVMQAIITFHTPTSDGSHAPKICDVAMITQQDLRDYRIERRPEAVARTAVAHPADLTANSMPFERQPNLGGMGTGSRVLYMSRGANVEQAYFVNDDDTRTWCDFSATERESVIVLDMTESRRVRKASLIHNRTPGEVTGYVVNHLPWLDDEETKPQGDANGNGNGDGSGNGKKKKAKAPPPVVNIPSSWFDELHKMGGGRTDEVEFTQMEAPVIECRYFVVRFVRSAPPQVAAVPVWLRPTAWWFAGVAVSDVMPIALSGSGGNAPFRLFDVNVFGDYLPEDWEVAPYDRESALVVTDTSTLPPTSTPKTPTTPDNLTNSSPP